MQAWHTRTAHCLHEEKGLAKHVHLGGCLSGVCYPYRAETVQSCDLARQYSAELAERSVE